MKTAARLGRRFGMVALALLLLAALAYVVLRAGPLAPVRVTVHEVARGSFSPTLFGIGTVEARRAYLIGPTTAGRVQRVLVDVGQAVKAGQLLAEMDPVDLHERLAALDASLARSGSAVQAAQAGRRDAQARRELAAINERRNIELGRQNFISASAVEAKLQERASADAVLSAAEANLAAASADFKRLAAERAGMVQQRDNMRLLAPADGLVTAREAEPGSTVVAGQAVLRLVQPESLWIRVRFDQGRSQGLAGGLPAQITLRSGPDAPLAGQVARIESLSDSVTEERVAMVSFERLPAGGAATSIGELAEVLVSLPATAPALLIPNASVQHQNGQSGVWRIQEGKPGFAAVRLGLASLDGQVQVLQGLAAGDRVVQYSEKALAPGSRIQVVQQLVGERP